MKNYIFILLTLSPMAWGASHSDDVSMARAPMALAPLSDAEVCAIFSSKAFSPMTDERKRTRLTVTPKELVGIGQTTYGLIMLRSVNDLVLQSDETPKGVVLDVLDRIKKNLWGLYWEKAGLGSAEIERISKLPTLQDVNLKHNALGPDDIRRVSRLSPFILQLRLSYNNLGDEGAAIIAAIAPVTIRILSLDNNKIGPEGIRSIVSRLTNLHTLYLEGNTIGDTEVNLITSSLPKLTHFAASDVTDASLEGLLKLKLDYLRLPNNKLSDEGKAALKREFPLARLAL